MVDSLILIRHAKAEDADSALDDSSRELTSAGIRAARASLPRMMGLVEDPKSYRIWSSPATRAWQTAEIAADALGLKQIERRGDLYSDEAALMRQKINEETGNLIVVGHNPFLEDLAADLTKHRLHFGKGAGACYSFPDGSITSAELDWFVQGADPSHWETVVELEEGLYSAARSSSSATWQFLDSPDDPELLEQMRTALRRLLALLEFVQPYLNSKEHRKLERIIEGFYRDASELKKLALPTQTATQWSAIPFVTPEAQRMYDRLRISQAERNRILAKLQTPTRQHEMHKTNHALRDPRWKKQVEADGLDAAIVRKRFKKMKRNLKKLQDAEAAGERVDTRKLRKLEERLSTIEESFAPILKKHHPE